MKLFEDRFSISIWCFFHSLISGYYNIIDFILIYLLPLLDPRNELARSTLTRPFDKFSEMIKISVIRVFNFWMVLMSL